MNKKKNKKNRRSSSLKGFLKREVVKAVVDLLKRIIVISLVKLFMYYVVSLLLGGWQLSPSPP